MQTTTGETFYQSEIAEKKKKSSEKRSPMQGLLAGSMVALPLVGLVSGAMGMASSAEQARDTLDELVKDVNTYTATHEGLMPSAEALRDIGVAIDGEGNVKLPKDYQGDQLEFADSVTVKGATLSEDLHTVEAYVRDVYGENVPTEFLELFDQAENEISYNRDSTNLALGSVGVGVLVGAPGGIALARSRSKDPTNPASIDTL